MINEPRSGAFKRVRDVYQKRSVLWLLIRRDLKVRYADSALGYVWSILDPLLMSLIFWLVFTKFFDRQAEEGPYIIFLLAAMLPFNWFTGAVGDSTKALKGEKLVRTTALPREIWVLRLVLAKGIEFLFSLPVLIAFVLIYAKPVTINIFYLPLAMLMQFMLLAGIGFIVAPIVVLVRDVDRVVRIALRFLFYATPVLYGVNEVFDRLPSSLHALYLYNPMVGIISLYRSIFFPSQFHWQSVTIAGVLSVLTLIIGWWVFAKFERPVLKEI